MTLAAIKRLGALVLVLCAAGLSLLAGAGAVNEASGLTLTVSGPTEVIGIPAPRYVVRATIANGGSVAATGVTISSTFPAGVAREGTMGVLDCDNTGLNVDVCTVPDIPPGGTAVVTWRYAPTEYGIDHHHLVAASAAPAMSDEADHDVRVLGPHGSTDWSVVVTPAAGLGGLSARHEVVVTNLGPATATNVVFNETLIAGEQLVSTSLGSACTLSGPTVLHCSLGTLAARASRTVAIQTKVPPSPTHAFHVVDVGSETPAVSASHLFGSAPAVTPWRYWLCDACASTTFEDGYELPSSFTVLADDTVRLSDGSVIRRDGVLERADGKLVLADGSVAGPAASPPGAPTGVAASLSDGKALVRFDPPAADGLPITSYTVTAEPGGYVYTGALSPIAAIGLTNGTGYTFTVKAWNGAGPGPASAPSATVTPLAVPEPPAGVSAVAGDGHAVVSFSPSPTAGVAYYTAVAFPGGRVVYGTESPILVSGLANGDSYTFSVTATNASGTGPESASSQAVVPVESSRSQTEPPPAEQEPRVAVPVPPPVTVARPSLPGR